MISFLRKKYTLLHSSYAYKIENSFYDAWNHMLQLSKDSLKPNRRLFYATGALLPNECAETVLWLLPERCCCMQRVMTGVTVAVTEVAGCIGSQLAEEREGKGYAVREIDREVPESQWSADSFAQFSVDRSRVHRTVDLADSAACKGLLDGSVGWRWSSTGRFPHFTSTQQHHSHVQHPGGGK